MGDGNRLAFQPEIPRLPFRNSTASMAWHGAGSSCSALIRPAPFMNTVNPKVVAGLNSQVLQVDSDGMDMLSQHPSVPKTRPVQRRSSAERLQASTLQLNRSPAAVLSRESALRFCSAHGRRSKSFRRSGATIMPASCWHIGRCLVELEQGGPYDPVSCAGNLLTHIPGYILVS